MKHRSLFLRIYLSFIVVLVVPIVVLGLVYRSGLLQSYQRDVIDFSLARVRSNRDAADEMMRNARSAAVELSLSPALRTLTEVGDTISARNADHVFAVLDVLKVLSNAQSANKDIDIIYLYNSMADMFFTSSREIEADGTFRDTAWLRSIGGGPSLPFWVGPRPAVDPEKAAVVNTMFSTHYEGQYATLVYPLSQYATTLPGAIAMNVTTNRLMTLVGRDDAETGAESYIYDISSGAVVGEGGSVEDPTVAETLQVSELTADERESGYYRSEASCGNDIVFFARSAETDWIYLEYNRYGDFYQNVRAVTVLVVGVSLLLLVAGVGLSYLGTRWLYNPVGRLVEDLRQQSGIDVTNESSDMRILSQAFTRLRQQESALTGAMERSRRKLADHLLSQTLQGLDEGDDFADAGLDFPHPYFLCAVAAIDSYLSFERAYASEQRHYVKELLLGIAEEILADRSAWSALQYHHDKLVFVFNTESRDWDEEAENITGGLRDVQVKASDALGISLTFSMGRPFRGRSGIERSFSDAMEGLKHRLVAGRRSFIMHWEQAASTQSDRDPAVELHRILNALKLGSEEKTQDALKEYFAQLHTRSNGYYEATQAINLLLAGTIEYLMEEHQDPADVFGNGVHPYERLASLETLSDVESWFSGVLNSIIAEQDISHLSNQRYLLRLTDYIDEHLTEDISADDVADQIGVSYYFMRRLFREQLRTTFHDYLNRKRIQQAKDLLRTTNRTLRDIALAVGYNNDQSFNRFFKKYEGVTPGEYRRIS